MRLPNFRGGKRPDATHRPASEPQAAQGDVADDMVPTSSATDRAPLTRDRLGELLTQILSDVDEWSHKYGYENVPPIEILRQVTHLYDAVGYAQGRNSPPRR